jgi:hypothetical protein
MAVPKTLLPTHWQDWCSWLLGFWLCVSPWILQFNSEFTATLAAVITGIVLVFVERMTLSFYQTSEEWINVALGAWIIISAWVIGISTPAARYNFVSVGLLVIALALIGLLEEQRQSGT